MGKLETIEQAIEALTPEELAAFRRWFAAYDADAWDRQIESDASAGKLDGLKAQALADIAAGRTRPL